MKIQVNKERLLNFCNVAGGMEVHRSWRDNMLKQGRDVKPEYMEWETLPLRDKILDGNIAHDVISDFLVWLEGNALLADN